MPVNIQNLIKNAEPTPCLKMQLEKGRVTQSEANLILLAEAIGDLQLKGISYNDWRDLILGARELTDDDREYTSFYDSQTSSVLIFDDQPWGDIDADRIKRGIKIDIDSPRGM